MAKGFTEEEREEIRQRLVEEGTKCFTELGFKKTGVRELASAVGVAPGTFYQFFPSKEDLFFEIMELEGNRMRKQIFEETLMNAEDPKKAMKSFYYRIMEELQRNALLKEIILKDEMDFVFSRLSQEQLDIHNQSSIVMLAKVFEDWVQKKLIKPVKPEVVVGAIRVLVFADLYKEKAGFHPETIDFILEQICEGLFIRKGGKEND